MTITLNVGMNSLWLVFLFALAFFFGAAAGKETASMIIRTLSNIFAWARRR